MSKSALRTAILTRRQNISPDELARANKAITAKLLKHIEWRDVERLHMYASLIVLNEVDTAEIERRLVGMLSQGSVDKGAASKTAQIPSDRYDVILVPVVAFDDDCNRLGYGGGWYDRFLAEQPMALKIGLAFDCQHVSMLRTEKHDIPLDVIVTESTIYLKQKHPTEVE